MVSNQRLTSGVVWLVRYVRLCFVNLSMMQICAHVIGAAPVAGALHQAGCDDAGKHCTRALMSYNLV